MAGGARVYYSMSCPNCGEPKRQPGGIALNKVGATKKSARKAKCVICRRFLLEREDK